MSDEYKIVVVEKFGYGFSDVVDEKRDMDTILSETRTALDKAGVKGPYILCPHSMSGLEALYWAQKYPDEVEAIIGLDMAVPDHYDEMDISIPLIKLGQYGAKLGITRWIPSLAESAAIKSGTLSEKEKEIYRVQLLNEGKPANMVDRIVEGKINKYYEEVVLMEQVYIKDPDGKKKVKDVLTGLVAKIGEKITIRRFVLMVMGEGLEKRNDDFAAEVAAQSQMK